MSPAILRPETAPSSESSGSTLSRSGRNGTGPTCTVRPAMLVRLVRPPPAPVVSELSNARAPHRSATATSTPDGCAPVSKMNQPRVPDESVTGT